MIAYRLLNAQTQPEFQDVPDPHAAPGQVLVKVGGSGLCYTDRKTMNFGAWGNSFSPLEFLGPPTITFIWRWKI